jgi:hypothetical protein
MDCFDNFDPLTGDVPSFPFYQLWGVASEARIFLAGLSGNDIRAIERHLDDLIYDTKADCARISLDKYVARVIMESSWELHYLPVGTDPTQQNVRRLLENWPESAEEPEPYLTEDDLSDLQALRIVISAGKLGTLDSEHSYPVQCASVLALMRVANCLDTLECPEGDLGIHEDGPIAARLLAAANQALEAALALGYASELAELAESRAEAAEDIAEAVEDRLRRLSEDRARKAATAGSLGARAKNARYEKLKIWALEKASTMSGDDKGIARKLFKELPSHLFNVSGDPERLIYDALRARKKPN